jgi:hypothetical protein
VYKVGDGIATVYLKVLRSEARDVRTLTARWGHASTHAPQSMHLSRLPSAMPPRTLMARVGQTFMHSTQPAQAVGSKTTQWVRSLIQASVGPAASTAPVSGCHTAVLANWHTSATDTARISTYCRGICDQRVRALPGIVVLFADRGISGADGSAFVTA